jgi:hypothetical protein
MEAWVCKWQDKLLINWTKKGPKIKISDKKGPNFSEKTDLIRTQSQLHVSKHGSQSFYILYNINYLYIKVLIQLMKFLKRN